MAQNFYTKWQNAILADAGVYVSKIPQFPNGLST